jgi:hypothetical protein
MALIPSVLRRDGSILIRKKCPGGPSNNGTYYNLSSYLKAPTPTHVKATIQNQSDGSLKIQIWNGTTPVLTVIDKGVGCAAITQGGKTGIRGDNLAFTFDNFTVTAL